MYMDINVQSLTIPDKQTQNIAEWMNRKPIDWILLLITKCCDAVLILQMYLITVVGEILLVSSSPQDLPHFISLQYSVPEEA